MAKLKKLDPFPKDVSTVVKANDKLAKLDSQTIDKLWIKAALDCTPIIEAILDAHWKAAKLVSRSGDLFKAAVADVAQMIVREKNGNLKLHYASGFDRKVYIRASVFTTGGVWHSGLSDSKASLKLKKSIKKVGVESGGMRIQPGRDLFKMTASQKRMVSEAFDIAFQKHLDILIK